MSATSTPYGLQPVNFPQGRVPLEAIPNGISSGYATAIGLYTPVTMQSTGVLAAATTAQDIYGVFMGCEFYTAGTSLENKKINWAASATYVAGTMMAYVITDPYIRYKIQSSGSIAQTAIGDEADFVNPGTVSTLGFSQAQINSTLAGVGVQGQLRILGKDLNPNNDWGDAYTDVVVEIARLQRVSNKVAI